jgi:hypothetical protein
VRDSNTLLVVCIHWPAGFCPGHSTASGGCASASLPGVVVCNSEALRAGLITVMPYDKMHRLTSSTCWHSCERTAAVIEKLRGQLVSMKKAGGDEPFKTAAGTMLKYIGNVARAPNEEKFRWACTGGSCECGISKAPSSTPLLC